MIKLGVHTHCIKLLELDISRKRRPNKYSLEIAAHGLYQALFDFLEELVWENSETQKIFLPYT